MDVDGKSSDVSVHIAWGGSCLDGVLSMAPALPDLLGETQDWDEFEAVSNPKPIEQQDLLPEDYCCPITSRLMREPVTTSDGHTYEREAIEKWLENHNTSPLAGDEPLESKKLTPALFVKNAVGHLLDKHPELRDSREWYLPDSWVRELAQACEAGNEALIRELVSRDRRLLVHTFGDNSVHGGKTALQLAVLSSNPKSLEVVVELLEKRQRGLALATLLQANAQGHSPLHQAILAHRDHGTLLQIMAWIGKRLDMIGAPQDWPLAQPSPLHSQAKSSLNAILVWSVWLGDPVKVGCLLRLQASPNTFNSQGQSVLYLAIAQQAGLPAIHGADEARTQGTEVQRKQVVKLLLDGGANPNTLNEDDEDGPLHLALGNNLLDVTEELLTAGAKLDLKLKNGTTPLHVVAAKPTTELANALWSGGDANPKELLNIELEAIGGEEGSTPLHCAAKSGSIPMLHWLVNRGAQITAVNARRQSILHVAALRNYPQFAEATKELMAKLSVETLSFPDCDGNTPLHLAAQTNAIDMMKWLLAEYGASPLRNRARQLPRQVAVSLGHSAWVMAYDETMAALKAKEEALLAEQHGPLGQLLLRQQRMIEMQQARLEQQEDAIHRLGARDQEFLQVKELVKTLLEEQSKMRLATQQSFLQHVVCGEYDQVEAMIQSNQHLLLYKGQVTDLSKRTFEQITGFQYAVWALDWRMWRMMLKYLPKAEAALQYEELGTQGTEHGAQVNWQQLIDAYNESSSESTGGRSSVFRQANVQSIARAQRLLPVHVMREYAEPNFHQTDFTQTECTASCSFRFWYGDRSDVAWSRGEGLQELTSPSRVFKFHFDKQAVTTLFQKRQEQLGQLARDLAN